MQRTADERSRWEAMLNELQDCFVLSKYDMLVSAVDPKVVPGVVLTMNQPQTTIRNWLNIMRNHYPERLVIMGKVLEYHPSETAMVLDKIRKYGFAELFGLTGAPARTYSKPTGRELGWDSPINGWGDLVEFKEFLNTLGQLLSGELQSMAAVTRDAGSINFYGMQENWSLWFFKLYQMQGVYFSRKIGSILEQSGSRANSSRQLIQRSGYSEMFFGSGSAEPVKPAEYGKFFLAPSLTSAPKASATNFIRNGGLTYVHHSTEDETITEELEKASKHPIMQMLKTPDLSVSEWLEQYPDGIHLVILALIRMGECSPYSTVKSRTSTIIQAKYSEKMIVDDALKGMLILPVKRLAQFTAAPELDEAVWPSLFTGVKPISLRKLLISYGKQEQEVNRWDPPKLIEVLGSHRQSGIDLLELLRENGKAPNMFPWLSSQELAQWLDPPDAMITEEAINLGPKALPPKLTQLGSLMAEARIDKPGFVRAYEKAGYEYEDMGFILKEIGNPNTKDILSQLTDPERVRLLRTWRKDK